MTEWIKFFSLKVIETNDLTGRSRIPSLSIRADQSFLKLMIAQNLSKNQSYTYNLTKEVNAGNWINLKISQISGVQEVKLDYKLVYNKTNSVPKTWTNVNLVTGNTTVKEKISTFVQYRNFKIASCKTKG